MAKKATTTVTRQPTEQQAMLIKLATRKDGVSRSEVRAALGKPLTAGEAGGNIPVQAMIKNLQRFGYRYDVKYFENAEEGRPSLAYYRLIKDTSPRKVAARAMTTKRPARKSAAKPTAKKTARKAPARKRA
jgi:hypothetical protein